MWTIEHQGDSTARPSVVFAVLADTDRWPEWNAGVRRIDIDRPFAAGTTATMALPDGTELPFRLDRVDPERGFEDVTEVPDGGVIAALCARAEAGER